MAVAWFRNPVLDDSVAPIDRNSINDRTFGITTTKRHPVYVYSINKNACLMHKIRHVTIHWHALIDGGHRLGRLKQPAMIARTVCDYNFALTAKRTRTCHVPQPDSTLCGRCHGEPASFGPHGTARKAGVKKEEARVKLGCVIAGYPSLLERDTRHEA